MVAAGIALPAVGACSKAPSGSGDAGGTFTWYTSTNHVYESWKHVVDKFAKDHDLTVNWQKFKWADMQTKLQADFTAGTVPDLVEFSGGDDAMQFVATGDVMSLDPYIAKDGKAMGYPGDWQKQAVTSWQYKGETYGVQLQLTAQQLYYNKKMLDHAGISAPPSTWDELLSAAKEMTSKKVYGIGLNADDTFSYPWILQAGARLYDKSTRQFLAPQNAAIKALQFQQDLIHKYKVSPLPAASSDFTASRQLLTAERAAMILTGPWDIKPIRTASTDLDLGIGAPLKDVQRATTFAGSGVFIPTRSPHPDAAWDLVKRLTALSAEIALTKEAGQTMPRKTWASSSAISSDPLLQNVTKAFPYAKDWGRDLASTGKLAEVDAAYKTLWQNVVLRGKSPAAEMKTFEQAAKAALGR